MYSDTSLAIFFGVEREDLQKAVTTVDAIEASSDEVLKLKQEEERQRKEDKKRERRLLNREQQLARRKAQDRDPLSKLFGTKEGRKKTAKGINKWLIAGLGFAGFALLSWNEEIKRDLDILGARLKDKIIEIIKEEIEKQKKKLLESIEKPRNLYDGFNSSMENLFSWQRTLFLVTRRFL